MDIEKMSRLLSKKTEVVTVKFSPELMQAIDQAVIQLDLPSRQSLIDSAVLTYLEAKKLI